MEDWALEDWALVEDGGLTPTCNNETYHADVHFMKLTIRGGRWRSRLPKQFCYKHFTQFFIVLMGKICI